jgi:hypothetical protein
METGWPNIGTKRSRMLQLYQSDVMILVASDIIGMPQHFLEYFILKNLRALVTQALTMMSMSVGL